MPLKRLLILIGEGDLPGTIKVKALDIFTDSFNEVLS
jgi:hypothetical protein